LRDEADEDSSTGRSNTIQDSGSPVAPQNHGAGPYDVHYERIMNLTIQCYKPVYTIVLCKLEYAFLDQVYVVWRSLEGDGLVSLQVTHSAPCLIQPYMKHPGTSEVIKLLERSHFSDHTRCLFWFYQSKGRVFNVHLEPIPTRVINLLACDS